MSVRVRPPGPLYFYRNNPYSFSMNMDYSDDEYYSEAAFCARAYSEWKRNRNATLKLQCFNIEEAELVKKIMQEKYPEVPFFVTWMTFK